MDGIGEQSRASGQSLDLGQRHEWPPEKNSYPDPDTGTPVIQWTADPRKAQHLYFTSPSVTVDGRWLVILSERDGHPNLYTVDRRDGNLKRVSSNSEGVSLAARIWSASH